MAIRKVILHVGQPKTGTTSIQDTLAQTENRALLARNGIHYPHPLFEGQYQGFALQTVTRDLSVMAAQNEYRVAGLGEPGILKKYLENTETALREAIRSRWEESDTLVIVGEHMYSFSIPELRRLKEYFSAMTDTPLEFRIVVYVRDPLKVISTNMQTCVTFFGVDIKRYEKVARRMRDYQMDVRCIGNFFEIFGKDAVKIYTFEDAIQSPLGGLVGHFLSVIGLPEPEIRRFNIVRANESQCQLVYDLFNYFNRTVYRLDGHAPNPERAKYNFAILRGLQGEKCDLSAANKIRIARILADDYRWLAEHIGIDYPSSAALAEMDERTASECVSWDEKSIIDLRRRWGRLTVDAKKLMLGFLAAHAKCAPADCIAALEAELSCLITIDMDYEADLRRCGLPVPLLSAANIKEDYAQIFFNNGNGFCEENSRRYPIPPSGELEINVQASPADNLINVRFDPSVCSSAVFVERVEINGRADGCKLTVGNPERCYQRDGRLFVFLEDDPRILLEPEPAEAITSLSIKMRREYDGELVGAVKARAVIDTLRNSNAELTRQAAAMTGGGETAKSDETEAAVAE